MNQLVAGICVATLAGSHRAKHSVLLATVNIILAEEALVRLIGIARQASDACFMQRQRGKLESEI